MENEGKPDRILSNQQTIVALLTQIMVMLKTHNDTEFIEDYLANILGIMTERKIFKDK